MCISAATVRGSRICESRAPLHDSFVCESVFQCESQSFPFYADRRIGLLRFADRLVALKSELPKARLESALVVIPSRDGHPDLDDYSTILEAYKWKCSFVRLSRVLLVLGCSMRSLAQRGRQRQLPHVGRTDEGPAGSCEVVRATLLHIRKTDPAMKGWDEQD